MKFIFLTLGFLLISSNLALAIKNEDAVDAAYRTCYAMEQTGMTSSCEVGVQKVDVRIDMSGGEARKTCAGVAKMMAGITNGFKGGNWKLRLFSTYSGEQPIAVCNLY